MRAFRNYMAAVLTAAGMSGCNLQIGHVVLEVDRKSRQLSIYLEQGDGSCKKYPAEEDSEGEEAVYRKKHRL